MKLKFKSDLKYQNEAIKSVVDIFKGQTPMTSNFTVLTGKSLNDGQLQMGVVQSSTGIGNKLDVISDDILKNVQDIQIRNNLPRSEKLDGMNFTVEMETGTGKTYVYLKSIYQLHKQYGFKKFVIVVPSVAIREGVDKSLEITKEHFNSIYDNESAEYFVYDSSKLEQVRNFATSNAIQIMIINIDAFRKGFIDPEKEDKANIIHRKQDKLNGQRPIDLIKETNPIVIIDEPQSVDTTPKSKEAISSLNPMCTLRYSATHVDKYNMIYRLDAVDAYEQRLVKKIEVLSVRSEESFNKPYIRLIETKERKAKIELDVQDKKGTVKRTTKIIKLGDDLFDISGEREIYRNYVVEDISWGVDEEYIIINGETIWLGKAIGDIDDDVIRRFQIRKTIEEHLEKENRLNKKGIKVLSLFFIDKVANYRDYSKYGAIIPGKYATMFEEEYADLIQQSRFSNNLNRNISIGSTHNGYFAQDKKGKLKDTKGNTQADEDVYSLIMKDKERLLDMSNPLRFIFSHSALREGWDNPNVFQICTLKDSAGTYIKRRQEIGRGLRLCVDQTGERVNDSSVNTLTVMANESYAEFVNSLQKELQEDTGVRFGVIEKHTFANVKRYDKEQDKDIYLGYDKSEEVYNYLVKNDYIDKKGNIQDKLKKELDALETSNPQETRFTLQGENLQNFFRGIVVELNHRCSVYEIKDASKKQRVKLNKAVIDSGEFIALWEKINTKTIYSVDFNSDELIERCINRISKMERIEAPRVVSRKDKVDITRELGATSTLKTEYSEEETYTTNYLPDIITELQNKTNLTRKTVISILVGSKRLEDFKRNPQKFIEEIVRIIRSELRVFVINGIKYEKIDDYYSVETFNSSDETLLAYLNDKVVESKKSPYDYTVCDSKVELKFAKRFESDPRVKVYVKLPNWFKIDTPLGNYNPDWAVVIEKHGVEKLYFVIETKGNSDRDLLRPEEKAKIECAEKHFEALGTEAKFKAPVSNVESFMLSV
ncbi:type III restriction-modification system endonuclease [Terrisporobacter glycolicus]|uniref:type III restriction-modification system endonuclease n=1 Tax=Terrisporobacter glycolicus TaxID=36841 RepID=UPI0034643FBE